MRSTLPPLASTPLCAKRHRENRSGAAQTSTLEKLLLDRRIFQVLRREVPARATTVAASLLRHCAARRLHDRQGNSTKPPTNGLQEVEVATAVREGHTEEAELSRTKKPQKCGSDLLPARQLWEEAARRLGALLRRFEHPSRPLCEIWSEEVRRLLLRRIPLRSSSNSSRPP